jgi:uncharacterized protein YcfL
MKRVNLLPVPLLLLFIVGCAPKPVEELRSAQQAVRSAKWAEAEVYASVEYQMASDSLREAEAEIDRQDRKFLLTRNYEKAKGLLHRVQVEAAEATDVATNLKEQVEE